ncbi:MULTISPECIES: anaerobic ribonucleoside-triphosphate reductase activating protein [Exiguobacterium]|uniref:anaerobic ribonucleoside-triphosphate reductase activating protein n=1 Tax=Exiguobacterium TaxID=33986 RepID=UPI000498286E|nr:MULTISPECIES: anaerobic ribonucleoside-triphosphate reductase activating protein [Exiguobacterium]TCI74056.1 anaerobic ribonucleoside-triphosphate reductase activating protein [Exiguobacterium sp. IPCI3]TCI83212.1 anaerobic ribonucleoside-triphosphate reductase activating protein [Exiguobacterium sp. IPCH1]TCI84266.1 anaerobic ribonucleoside-triphosphate reductase activating protein [Exiguobacterium sp. IPBC4]
MRVLSVLDESVVDGPGIRTVIFTAGCPHRCLGCHNPESWNPRGGEDVPVEDLLARIEQSGWDGVTVSGGEPFLQPEALARLVDGCKALQKNVWVYTGYTIEQLQSMDDEYVTSVLDRADVLVDGRFEQPLMDRSLRFRGSSNQRIIFLNKA